MAFKQILVCAAAVSIAYGLLKDLLAWYEKSQGNIKRTESTIRKDQQVKKKKRRIYKPKHVSVSGVYTAHYPPVRTKKKERVEGEKAKSKGNAKRKSPQFTACIFVTW